MKTILVIGFLLFPLIFPSQINIGLVRKLYHESPKSEIKATQFFKLLENTDAIKIPLIKGYKGVSYMIQANYNWNPYQKLNYFNTGKQILEDAINQDKLNIELRYIRLAVQLSVPSFLGYSSKKKEDKDFILDKLPEVRDSELKNKILEFISTSDYFREQEKLSVKQ